MSRTGSIILRLVGVLIIIGLLFGAGAIGYRAGVQQGFLQGQAAAALTAGEEAAQLPVLPGIYPGYYAPWYRPFGGFSIFGAILGFFVFGFLLLFALRLIFRPRRWGPGGWGKYPPHWHGAPGPWGGPRWAPEGPPEGPAPQPDRPQTDSEEYS